MNYAYNCPYRKNGFCQLASCNSLVTGVCAWSQQNIKLTTTDIAGNAERRHTKRRREDRRMDDDYK